jgi:hypothetical protein
VFEYPTGFSKAKTVSLPEQLGIRGVLWRLPGRKMNDRKDKRPANVVPVGQTVPRVIGDELSRYYKSLVEQELPDKISALYERFDELTKEKSGPEPQTRTLQNPAAKKPRE